MSRWWTIARRIARGIWFRAMLFTIAAIVVAVLAWAASSLLPDDTGIELGQSSVGSLLEILATSMLAVTTFSLTTMVAAYTAAATAGTPRSTQLLITDSTSQNALSTYVGAFAFSIVGIIALSLEVYSETGKALLFAATVLVVALVLVSLLRWISFLADFGRTPDVIERLERAATRAMIAQATHPRMGASRWIEPASDALPIATKQPGYVVRIDVEHLERVAQHCGCELWVLARPGARVSLGEPLVLASSELGHAAREHVLDAFFIEAHRTFEQDARLGLIALSEVASKALSPAVNDPGTAVEVLGALERVLRHAIVADPEPEIAFPLVRMRGISVRDLLTDAFRPAARDGAGIVEVCVRLQRELGALAAALEVDPVRRAEREVWEGELRRAGEEALARAENALHTPGDLAAVREAHAAWADPAPDHAAERSDPRT